MWSSYKVGHLASVRIQLDHQHVITMFRFCSQKNKCMQTSVNSSVFALKKTNVCRLPLTGVPPNRRQSPSVCGLYQYGGWCAHNTWDFLLLIRHAGLAWAAVVRHMCIRAAPASCHEGVNTIVIMLLSHQCVRSNDHSIGQGAYTVRGCLSVSDGSWVRIYTACGGHQWYPASDPHTQRRFAFAQPRPPIKGK